MSNKAFNNLCDIDQWLRKAYPVGMRTGVDVTIQKIIGFERFNTRPYHNYETWSDGYRVFDDKFTVEREDLDDALKELLRLRWNYINETIVQNRDLEIRGEFE